jgi:anthranilate phosphoribosyltransferase
MAQKSRRSSRDWAPGGVCVHSEDGLDEISLGAVTRIPGRGNEVSTFEFTPRRRPPAHACRPQTGTGPKTPHGSAPFCRQPGPDRDYIIINAGGALLA